MTQNQLTNDQSIINTVAAQSIVLFVQSQMKSKTISGEHMAYLNHSAQYVLYVIREINGQELPGDDDKEEYKRETAKHKELYYYDYNLPEVVQAFINSQDEKWQSEYYYNCERLYKIYAKRPNDTK